jgi:hypothetical protein
MWWWFLITGKIVSLFCYSLLVKHNCHFDCSLFNNLLESYEISMGRLFIADEKTRRLITNLLILYRNILIWPLILTVFEFCFIFSVLGYLIHFILIYLKSEKTKFSLLIIVINSYMALIYFFKTFVFFNRIDFYYISNFFIMSCFIIAPFYCIYVCNFIIYVYIFKHQITKNSLLKFYLIKFFVYFFSIIIITILTSFFLSAPTNNFLQEFIINFFIIYIYVYYKI